MPQAKADLTFVNIPINVDKETKILRAYRTTEDVDTDTAFGEACGWTRQSTHQYLNGIHSPKTEDLILLALEKVGTWQGDLAVELLNGRNPNLVPCKCSGQIGGNGPCPRHGTLEEAVHA